MLIDVKSSECVYLFVGILLLAYPYLNVIKLIPVSNLLTNPNEVCMISASLTYIINQSLTTGIFPNDWKVARVTPLYKDDTKTNPDNPVVDSLSLVLHVAFLRNSFVSFRNVDLPS